MIRLADMMLDRDGKDADAFLAVAALRECREA